FSRDWSSDVCSSDLADHAAAVEQAEGVAVPVDVVEVGREAQLDHLPRRLGGGDGLGDRLLQLAPHVVEQLGEQLPLGGEVLVEEIGRAACRERVEGG